MPLISSPTDAAEFDRHSTRLRLLAVALGAREATGRLPEKAQLVEALYSIRALRNLLAIEQTRRRVNGRVAA